MRRYSYIAFFLIISASCSIKSTENREDSSSYELGENDSVWIKESTLTTYGHWDRLDGFTGATKNGMARNDSLEELVFRVLNEPQLKDLQAQLTLRGSSDFVAINIYEPRTNPIEAECIIDRSYQDSLLFDLELDTVTMSFRLSNSPLNIDTALIYRTDTYHETNGDIIIQHGYPRGGGDLDGLRGYKNQEGQQFGHAFFWTRLVNETSETIDLDISFPGDSIKYDKSDSAYLKFFIVPTPFDLSSLEEYSYGITGFRYHLDTAFYEPQIAQSSIPPGGDFGFYMAVLTHEGFYAWRNALLIDGDSLKYSVRTNATDSLVIDLGMLHRNQ